MANFPALEAGLTDSKFLGYDYSQGDYHFSLLIDDLLMSKTLRIAEFDRVFDKLNENMLFSTLENVIDYINIRERLKAENKYDFEFDYCAQIIRISIVNIENE